MPRLLLAAAVGVAFLALACRSVQLAGYQEANSFAGRYQCYGENAMGQPYTILLDIVARGATYELFWRNRQGQPVLHGLGLLMNDHLAVALVRQGRVGVAMYAVTPGRLTGLWTGGGMVMPETCTQGAAA